MAARDRQSSNIKCPMCEAKGVVHYSDNDYPFMRRNAREIDRVEGDFGAKLTAQERFDMTCKKCGHRFVT